MKNYEYLLTMFILFSFNMKYETWASSMHCPWIVKDSKSSPLFLQGCLKLFKHSISPSRDIEHGQCTPHVHTQHTSSQWHHYSHLNVIININIISSQYHYQHPQHLISISSLTSTSSHLNIIININIILSQLHHQHHK